MDDPVLDALEDAYAQTKDTLLGFYLLLRSWHVQQRESLPERSLAPTGVTKLARDEVPILQFQDLGLEPEPFNALLDDLGELWEQQDPGALEELAGFSPPERLALAETWFRTGQSGQGPAVDGLIGNALAPQLEWAAEQLTPYVPSHLWALPACPVCGGWPDFALWRDEGDTPLICERCRATWQAALQGCFFCGETDPEQRGVYVSDDETYAVEVCDTCGHYLKGLLETALPPNYQPLLSIERLLTPGLDLLALEEGYARPDGVAREPRA